MIHLDQIQSSNKSNHGCEGRKQGKKQKLKKKGLMEVERKAKNHVASGGGVCKTRENSKFLKKGKTVISVKIQNFSRSRMTKQTSPLESSREI